MEQMDVLIIGAGAVGLAIGYELAGTCGDVVVVEKEDSFGRHTSSRNSEVIHSGIYYPQNTDKALLCLEGNGMLYDFCQKYDIPHANCGKIVVATKEDELVALEALHRNGVNNRVEGLQLIDGDQCHEIEPTVTAIRGLWVPSTGIFDTHSYMKRLADLIEEKDGFVIYDMPVENIEKIEDGYRVHFPGGEIFQTRILINCGGLFSEQIAKMAGIDTVASDLQIHWCKGEYFKTTHLSGIKHLVYPMPDPQGKFLGIHLTINLNGEVRFGPNAYYVNEINYAMDERNKPEFLAAVTQYIDVDPEFFSPDDCGIRPKLQKPGGAFRDFYIREESERGLPRFINLMGIESPGLTASLAIAKKVRGILEQS